MKIAQLAGIASLAFAPPLASSAGQPAGSAVAGPFHAPPAKGQPALCVRNESAMRYLFAADPRAAPRITAMLAPGGVLCAPDPDRQGGVVSVFAAPEDLEGCSRLVPPGDSEALRRYAEFDRCAWASHD